MRFKHDADQHKAPDEGSLDFDAQPLHWCEQAQANEGGSPKAMPTAEGLRDDLCKDDDEGCKANAPSARTSHGDLLHSVPYCMHPMHFRCQAL